MRASLLIAPLVVLAAPAAAAEIQVPRELTDPAMADKLSNVMQALSKAFLDMPLGEVEAAIEGREPTAADRRKTVRSETRMSERQFGQQIDAAKPQIQAAMKAMATALPAMMKGFQDAGRELEKATANMPQPGYPRR